MAEKQFLTKKGYEERVAYGKYIQMRKEKIW